MSTEREEKHKELRHQLDAAIKRRDKASEQFDQVIREIPSGLPQQEGHDRILRASREYSATQTAVTAALLDLNNFLGVKGPTASPKKD